MMITDDLNQLAMDAKACDAAKAELAGITLELLQRTAKVRPDRYGLTQLDDLLQNYFCGRFHQDVSLYDPTKGQRWRTFAVSRFRYSVSDYLRLRESQPTANHIGRTGRTINSVSTELVLHEGQTAPVTIGSNLQDHSRDAAAEFEIFNERIKTLHRRERLMMILIYIEGMTMKQVGKQIGLSESRVSQMHSNCLKRIERSIER